MFFIDEMEIVFFFGCSHALLNNLETKFFWALSARTTRRVLGRVRAYVICFLFELPRDG